MIPAAVTYFVLASPLARAASFGEMAGTSDDCLERALDGTQDEPSGEIHGDGHEH